MNIFILQNNKYIDISNIFQSYSSGTKKITNIYKNGIDIGNMFDPYFNIKSIGPTNIYINGLDINNSFSIYPAGLISWINPVLYTNSSTIIDGINNNITWNLNNITYNNIRNTLVLNGTTSFLTYNNNSTMANWNGNNFTFIIYYYKNSTNTGEMLLTVNRTPTNTINEILYRDDVYFDFNGNFGLNYSYTPSTTIGWTFYAFSRNNTATGTHYLNGSILSTSTNSANIVTVGNANFCVGKDFRDNIAFLNGEIYFFGIWNVSLSPTQIKTMYDYFNIIKP